MQKKRIASSAATAGVAAALAVIGYIVLPDTLVVQFDMAGHPGNTMPKLLALGISLLISLSGSAFWLFSQKKNKGLLVGIIGIVMLILTFVFNL